MISTKTLELLSYMLFIMGIIVVFIIFYEGGPSGFLDYTILVLFTLHVMEIVAELIKKKVR